LVLVSSACLLEQRRGAHRYHPSRSRRSAKPGLGPSVGQPELRWRCRRSCPALTGCAATCLHDRVLRSRQATDRERIEARLATLACWPVLRSHPAVHLRRLSRQRGTLGNLAKPASHSPWNLSPELPAEQPYTLDAKSSQELLQRARTLPPMSLPSPRRAICFPSSYRLAFVLASGSCPHFSSAWRCDASRRAYVGPRQCAKRSEYNAPWRTLVVCFPWLPFSFWSAGSISSRPISLG